MGALVSRGAGKATDARAAKQREGPLMSKLSMDEATYEQHVGELSAAFSFKGFIPKTELRAITLAQLLFLFAFVERCCSSWRIATVAAMDAQMINLYHLNDWLIKPATNRMNCAFVELLATGFQR